MLRLLKLFLPFLLMLFWLVLPALEMSGFITTEITQCKYLNPKIWIMKYEKNRLIVRNTLSSHVNWQLTNFWDMNSIIELKCPCFGYKSYNWLGELFKSSWPFNIHNKVKHLDHDIFMTFHAYFSITGHLNRCILLVHSRDSFSNIWIKISKEYDK